MGLNPTTAAGANLSQLVQAPSNARAQLNNSNAHTQATRPLRNAIHNPGRAVSHNVASGAASLYQQLMQVPNGYANYRKILAANKKNRRFLEELAKRIPCGQELTFDFSRNFHGEITAISQPGAGFLGGNKGTTTATVTGTGDITSPYFRGTFGYDSPAQIQSKTYGVPLQPSQLR